MTYDNLIAASAFRYIILLSNCGGNITIKSWANSKYSYIIFFKYTSSWLNRSNIQYILILTIAVSTFIWISILSTFYTLFPTYNAAIPRSTTPLNVRDCSKYRILRLAATNLNRMLPLGSCDSNMESDLARLLIMSQIAGGTNQLWNFFSACLVSYP